MGAKRWVKVYAYVCVGVCIDIVKVGVALVLARCWRVLVWHAMQRTFWHSLTFYTCEAKPFRDACTAFTSYWERWFTMHTRRHHPATDALARARATRCIVSCRRLSGAAWWAYRELCKYMNMTLLHTNIKDEWLLVLFGDVACRPMLLCFCGACVHNAPILTLTDMSPKYWARNELQSRNVVLLIEFVK